MFNEKPDWYEVQNVAEIEDFDPDKYGNIWYNVKFVGDAATHMWLAKEKPEEGKKYHGHFEKTKSGKRLRFKRTPKDDIPEDSKPPEVKKAEQDKGDAITRSMVVKLAFQAFIQAEGMMPQESKHWRQIAYMADELYKTIHGVPAIDPVIEDIPDEVTLDDINVE